MRKNIIPFAVCALMLAGCKDYSYETWTPDPTLHRSGEVSLLVSFENLKTKVFMDEQGHGTWDGGDQIAVACSDGSFITFTLDVPAIPSVPFSRATCLMARALVPLQYILRPPQSRLMQTC